MKTNENIMMIDRIERCIHFLFGHICSRRTRTVGKWLGPKTMADKKGGLEPLSPGVPRRPNDSIAVGRAIFMILEGGRREVSAIFERLVFGCIDVDFCK